MLKAILPARLLSRWNAIALQQLAEIATRQAEEIEQLRDQLSNAEETADFWHEQAIAMQEQLCEKTGTAPGLTVSGALVTVPADEKQLDWVHD